MTRLGAWGCLFRVNARHYAHALLGIGCAFIPRARDLSVDSGRPELEVSVLEYRGILLVVGVAAALSSIAGREVGMGCVLLLAVWGIQSICRAVSLRSRYAFWLFLWGEQKRPHGRIVGQLMEAAVEEIEMLYRRLPLAETAAREKEILAVCNEAVAYCEREFFIT